MNHHPLSTRFDVRSTIHSWATTALLLSVALGALPGRADARADGLSPTVPAASSATRSLPGFYSSGVTLTVTIAVNPAADVVAHAIEDTPPAGWTVGVISDGGVWDANNKRVKWGPYFDALARTVTYTVTPPAGVTGTRSFSGLASFDGVDVVTVGTLNVEWTRATPVVTWANPAGIAYGTALGATQLNATADVPGTFAYAPASGTVLNAGAGQTLSVTFTPTDTANYTAATKTVTIDVTTVTPVVTWATPARIVYGAALSATQLNATANVVGTFAYTPVAGTVLGVGAGQTLSVTFTPTDTVNYTTATKTVAIDVTQATPVVTWANPAGIVYGTALSATQLNAAANVAGTFTYTPASGTVLGVGAGQTLSVTFTPADTVSYTIATRAVTIDVTKATPVVTWAGPASVVSGTELGAAQLNATANAAGTFVYTPPAGTVLAGGMGQVLSVTFTPADTAAYTTASKTVTIDVTWVPPVLTGFTPGSGVIGSGVTLTGTAFTGTTGVTFHGVSAAYSVLSDTEVTTTVPTGTTTGPLRLTTPGGTATGATNFVVTNQWADRVLPACYVPGYAVTVSVDVGPAPAVLVQAVEDTLPAGWTAGAVSDGGAWDALSGKVKWGPYSDATARVLTYVVTPPAGTTGAVTFAGVVSFDGVEVPLGGTATLSRCEQHPADANSDFRLVIGEVTGYGAAWKRGSPWTVPPEPIPIGYVTRAGYLWRLGETYRRDAGDCPVCWVPLPPVPLPLPDAILPLDDIPTPRSGPWCPGSSEIVRSPGASAFENRFGGPPQPRWRRSAPGAPAPTSPARSIRIGTAVRQAPATYVPTVPLTVTIAVTPDGDVQTWALEETVPEGWRVSQVSADGYWDEKAGVVRWGPFFDETPQTLRYTLTPPTGVAGPQELRGTASFDGADVAATGARTLQRAPITRPGDPGSPAGGDAGPDGRGDANRVISARK